MAGSEKLGRCYGKQALEWEWGYPTALKCDAIDERIEGAVLVRDLGELGELARLMETLKDPRIASIVDIDWQIGLFEQDLEAADGPQDRADIDERHVRLLIKRSSFPRFRPRTPRSSL